MHERFDWHFILHNFFDYWICALENGVTEIAQSSFNICMEMKLRTKQYTFFFFPNLASLSISLGF